MGINLTPLSAREASIGSADDPYKRYWWAILAGFVLTGAWLCVPVMETQVGSGHVDAAKPADAANAEQNLDSADNPSGAPGSALDLSMDEAKRKSKNDADVTSMLYQAPPESGAAAAGAPLGAASGGASLAQQLKDAGKASAGGWGEKAQSGFSAPHLGGGGLAGLGAAAGGSSASSGGANAFGSRNAQVGFGATVGLRGDGGADSGPAGFQSLQKTAAAMKGLTGSAESLHASMSNVFDAGKGKKPANIGSGMSDAMVSAHAALDAAPADLKTNDPKLDAKKLPEPPAAPAPSSNPNSMQQLGQQMAMIAATAIVGGLIPGVGGQMVMMMGMAAMQQQQAAKAAASQQSQQTTAGQRISGS